GRHPTGVDSPADVDLGCNPPDPSPDATGWARAHDPCDPVPRVTYTDRVSTTGCRVVIERIWQATDACGNAAPPKTQRITYVQDTTPPILTVPPDATVECHQVPPVGAATATDSCDPTPRAEYLGEERMGGPCPFTYTLVRTWRATDACGNKAEKRQTITVRDATPLALTPPPDVDLGCNPTATGPDATGWATAEDTCDPAPQLTYTDRVSTTGCRVTIERTWRAQDACGNAAAPRAQQITYTADTTPPTITCPGTITVSTCFPPGFWLWVPYGITASDACGTATLVCDRHGDWFQVGTTTPVTVTCTATDPCGNSASRVCSFLVTVRGNQPPAAWDEAEKAPTGVVCLPVPAFDPDGDPLWIEVSAPSPCGATWVEGNRVCYGTFGCEGGQIPPGTVARFLFRVTDPCGASASGWVYVRITCEICPTSVPPEGKP
ncbi:MAG: HYR domain-containing protein, partial [Candidatus Bipolaricaulota bacterium]|nr:HYR domain-containing protein [Candidatus Bipolaricaulota bacterium]